MCTCHTALVRILLRGLLPGAVGLLPVLMAAPASAQVSSWGNLDWSTTMSSLVSNSDVTTTYLGTSSKTGLVSQAPVSIGSGDSAATITFTGTSGIYSGAVSGVAAPPVTSAGTPTAANYLAAEPSGAATVTYASSQKYFGLLWGSVDSYNQIAFYNNGVEVGALTGSQITQNADGNQGQKGSYFVNIDVGNGQSFNKVVLTSGSPAFEFDTITYAASQQGIAPAPLSLPGGTPAGFVVLGLGLLPWLRARAGAKRASSVALPAMIA